MWLFSGILPCRVKFRIVTLIGIRASSKLETLSKDKVTAKLRKVVYSKCWFNGERWMSKTWVGKYLTCSVTHQHI